MTVNLPNRQRHRKANFAYLALDRICQSGNVRAMPDYPNRIKELREKRRMTIESLADAAGLSVSYASRIENGKRNLSVKNLAAIADALGVAQSEILAAPADVVVQHVPLVSWVSAGRLWAHEPVEAKDITTTLSVAGLGRGDWIALTIDGDSINRIAPSGAIVFVNRADTHLISGKFYVFSYDSGEATIKRFRSNPDRLEPYSTNPEHDTIFPESGLRVIGRARRVIIDID